MGWELKNKPSTSRVTAKMAKEWSEMEAAHVDRPMSERRLQVYRKVRSEGGFRPVTWAKAWCEETQQWYRVNGKHTSTLFSDGEKLDNIYVTVEEYTCDTLEDVAKWWLGERLQQLKGTYEFGPSEGKGRGLLVDYVRGIREPPEVSDRELEETPKQ